MITSSLIVVVAEVGKFFHFLLEERRFLLVANHFNHIATSRHA